MKQLLTLSTTAICCPAFFDIAAPAAAKDYEYYCRKDVTAAVLQCGFDTLDQGHVVRTRRRLPPQSCSRWCGAADAYAYAPAVRGTHVYAPGRQK